MLPRKQLLMPWFMWLFPLLFFAYQFILRLWPGLMMQTMMTQLHIDAGQFGILVASYYYGYAGMQIPIAVLLDRFGARSIMTLFALICCVGMYIMTETNNFYIAVGGRFLIGVGSAVAFLGISKIVSDWFPRAQYARMIGITFTLGLMGAVYGGKPTNQCIETYGWQNVAVALSLLAIVLAGLIYLCVRPCPPTNTTSAPSLKASLSALRSPSLWWLAIANLLMVGSLEGFADVWGVTYLMTLYGIDKGQAAGLTSFIFCGMLVGGPLLAWLAQRLGNYTIMVLCGLGMASIYSVFCLATTYHAWLLTSAFFMLGILCCYQVIVFASGTDWVAPQHLGMTVAFLNSINMLGGSFFHTIIGCVMDAYWSGQKSLAGTKLYDPTAYTYALSVIPLCAVLGAVIIGVLGAARRRC